jgi:hypothetical protein
MMTVAKKMNDGVALLLERMKTNPEEFVPNNGSSKWGSLIAAYKDFLEPEDRQVLSTGVNKLLQQAFTEKVMQELIEPKEGTLKEGLRLGAIPTGTFGATIKAEGGKVSFL